MFFRKILAALIATQLLPAYAVTVQEIDLPSGPALGAPGSTVVGADYKTWYAKVPLTAATFTAPWGGIVSRNSDGSDPLTYITSEVPSKLVSGPDGNIWFTEYMIGPFDGIDAYGGKIGRITPTGQLTEFDLPTPDSVPADIVVGPDNALWFTERNAGKIGRITVSGKISEFPVSSESTPTGIAVGGDGNLWFTEMGKLVFNDPEWPDFVPSGRIGRITPEGAVTEYPLKNKNSSTGSIAATTDGSLWFSEFTLTENTRSHIDGFANIGHVVPGKDIEEHSVAQGSSVGSIVSDGRGGIWFADVPNNSIAHVTSAFAVQEYPVPTQGSGPGGLSIDTAGSVWFAEGWTYKLAKLSGTEFNVSKSFSGATGNWFNPDESGHGFSLQSLPGNVLLAEWYVFDGSGNQAWLVASGTMTGNTATLSAYQSLGGYFPPHFNSAETKKVLWGTINLSFSDCNNAKVSWNPVAMGYSKGSASIVRLTKPVGVSCN